MSTSYNYSVHGVHARRPKGKRRTKRHERTAKADDGTRDEAGKMALYAPSCGRAHYTAASHVLQVREEKDYKRAQGSGKRCLQVQGRLWSMSLKDDEKGFYYKLEIIVCMLAFLFFAIADYNRANFLMLFLIFHRLLKDK